MRAILVVRDKLKTLSFAFSQVLDVNMLVARKLSELVA